MDFCKMLHELIDSLDNKTCERIYYLVMGILGKN